MKMHAAITEEVILDAVERGYFTLDNPGFCIKCGLEAYGCEPDMRKGECESCGKDAVWGAEELMIHIVA